MKSLFIEPPFPRHCWITRGQAGKFGTLAPPKTVFPPLDFAYAAAVLEENGYEFELIDAPALNFNVKKLMDRVSNDESSLVIVNTSVVSLTDDLNVASLIKEKSPESLVCVTGSLVSVMPDVALSNPAIDIVIQGEIEYTIVELLKAVEAGQLKDVHGIAYKKDGVIVKNRNQPLSLNLDELPFPAYHHLPIDRYYYNLLPRRPFVTMLTSRGCPYKCFYCPYTIGFGSIWRKRSPSSVLDEIQLLVDKFNVKSVLLKDQVFTFDMKRAEEICEGIVERGIDIQWRCETRVDRLSEKLMLKMKEAGCVGIHVGIESGDPKILSAMAKRGLNIDMVRKIFATAKDVGIGTSAFFIIGLPGETKRSIWASYKLARQINPDIIQFTMITPYPGTELYDMAKEKGWILTEDWTKYNLSNVVMRTDKLSKQDLTSATEYLEACLAFRNKYFRRTSNELQRLLGRYSPLSRFTKKFSTVFGNYLRRNAERRFELWATQS